MTIFWRACVLRLVWAAIGLGLCPLAMAQDAAKIPAANFYRPATLQSAKLSPDGQWLALATTATKNGRVGLAVFDLKTWAVHGMAAQFGDADIRDFYWVNNERLVFNILDRELGSGNQRWWPGLYSVKRDGSEMRQLVKLSDAFIVGERGVGREPLEAHHQLLHVPATEGNEVIVGEYRFDHSGVATSILAKRLDIVTGRATTLASGAPEHTNFWMFTPQGEPRLVGTWHQGRVTYHWRDAAAAPWRQIGEFDALDRGYTPRSIDSDGNLYVTNRLGDFSVLRKFDFARNQAAAEPLVSTPGFDYAGIVVSEINGGEALGVRVTTDAETTVWFDERLAKLQVEADKRFPGRINRLVCRRCLQPDMTVLVNSWSDRDPGQYWMYFAQDERWRKVGDSRAGIVPAQMGTTDMQRVRTRDGLDMPVWVTTPAGKFDGPRPAVVLVHGGPWVRGKVWGWYADAQFLASRGYVVIEPEFRGSTGYGNKLYRSGFKQWGQAMQDDVADATAWAVAEQKVDAKRICIAGASYGGYATLMGLIRHPELYRCGLAWVAVTDPNLMFTWRHDSDVGDESRNFSYPALIGDPVADKAMLDSVTPALLAARIKAPVMLAFGGSDRRVPPIHGTRMRDALEAAGNKPEWLVYADEGHGWLKLETRVDFANRMEAFFAKHLK